MDNKIMMQNAAIRVCALLEKFGITATISNYQPEPIDKCLRGAWYISKMKQYGVCDTIHIQLDGGFLAITDKCEVMSGSNFMVSDAFSYIDCALGFTEGFYLSNFGFKCWDDGWGEDGNAFIIGDMHTFESFLHHYDGKHVVECEIELPF